MNKLNVYRCFATGEDNSLYYLNEDEISRKTLGFRGQPMKSVWVPIAVEPRNLDRPELVLDFIDFGSSPTFSSRSIDLLGEVLSKYGEILPLESQFGNFFVFNVTNVVDALDEEKSDIQRLPSGIATHANKYVFRQQMLPGNLIFKVPLFPPRAFFTSEFVDLVSATDLKGFEFTEL